MQEKNDYRNLILAIAVSMVILLGFQLSQNLGVIPSPAKKLEKTEAAVKELSVSKKVSQQEGAKSVEAPVIKPALLGQKIEIVGSKSVAGSINTAGLRFDDLSLLRHRETVDPKSPPIHLLSGGNAKLPYYAELGWVSADKTVHLPDENSVWQMLKVKLGVPAELMPLTWAGVFTWDNGSGLEFTRRIYLDGNYMFTIEQTVHNKSTEDVSLATYGKILKNRTAEEAKPALIHEGPAGVLNGKLQEADYNELTPEAVKEKTTGGWAGYKDKYWLTAFVPDQKKPITAEMQYTGTEESGTYSVTVTEEPVTIAPGESATSTVRLFAGAKEVHLIDAYADKLGIDKFDLAIDFGWFYFLTKPFFYAIDFFGRLFGNFGLAIIALTIIVRLAMYPLANKSFTSMSKMKKLQPEIDKLRQLYGKDQARMSQELMALYKREGVSPLGGCLPTILQIPVFFALYKVLYMSLEVRHAPFFGWIKDLSAADPTSVFNLFGLIPWHPPAIMMIGAWPLFMGLTMLLQQQLNPKPADPMQAKLFLLMPIFMTYLLSSFPAGLVVYWTCSNVLSILQQLVISRRVRVKGT